MPRFSPLASTADRLSPSGVAAGEGGNGPVAPHVDRAAACAQSRTQSDASVRPGATRVGSPSTAGGGRREASSGADTHAGTSAGGGEKGELTAQSATGIFCRDKRRSVDSAGRVLFGRGCEGDRHILFCATVFVNVQLVAMHKQRIAALESELEKKNQQIAELLRLSEEQNQRGLEDKIELVELKSKTMLEMELQAAEKIRKVLMNECFFSSCLTGRSDTETTDDDTSTVEGLEEIDHSMNVRRDLLNSQLNTLLDGIKWREKELQNVKLEQAKLESMSSEYEERLREMTERINRMEGVRLRKATSFVGEAATAKGTGSAAAATSLAGGLSSRTRPAGVSTSLENG